MVYIFLLSCRFSWLALENVWIWVPFSSEVENNQNNQWKFFETFVYVLLRPEQKLYKLVFIK